MRRLAFLALIAALGGCGQTPTASAPPGRVTFAFAPKVTPGDRQAFEAALASARPEARALIDRVDGMVRVDVGATGASAVGLTTASPGHYDVVVDLRVVSAQYGQRGIDRVVLHEIGHVVDHALVQPALAQQLDTAIPAGYGCDDGGHSGGCASREERFAESFAKWATGDIGVDLYLGYRVPPPAASWGAQLVALAR